MVNDNVNHPSHYTRYKIEVIQLTRRLNFSAGNTVKYIVRSPFKNNMTEDLSKALWYAKDIAENAKKSTRITLKERKYDQAVSELNYFHSCVRDSNIPCKEYFAELMTKVFYASVHKKGTTKLKFKTLRKSVSDIIKLIENDKSWIDYFTKNVSSKNY